MMNKKLLIVDRDGTMIDEPDDYQVDTLDKLKFRPYAISSLARLRTLDFELIMASNQDGLGTLQYPTREFETVQQKLLSILENEGVTFDEVLIDISTEQSPSSCRKPCVGLFANYLNDGFDRENSFVIGDRLTDMQLAENLEVNGIFYRNSRMDFPEIQLRNLGATVVLISDDWREIAEFVRRTRRCVTAQRTTHETAVTVQLDLDRCAVGSIRTGLNFFDHMLQQLSVHGGFSLDVTAHGDLQVDEHHTIEDTAIVLGEAFRRAIGSTEGMARYGFALPMDESRAAVLIDFSNRPEIVWRGSFRRERVGDMPTEMVQHFFRSFAFAAGCTLFIRVEGANDHHKIEALFKAFARAVRAAVRRESNDFSLPSSKGVLW